jgi:hypothetical protein
MTSHPDVFGSPLGTGDVEGPRIAELGLAPELLGVQPWFNTPEGMPLTLARLSGASF